LVRALTKRDRRREHLENGGSTLRDEQTGFAPTTAVPIRVLAFAPYSAAR
jgi:hypothetical protein